MATRIAQLPTEAPALTPERPVIWPKRTKTRLANGLEVVLAESHSIPKFHGQLSFRSGNAGPIFTRGMALRTTGAWTLTRSCCSLRW